MNKDQNTSENLDSAYREMAQDDERESEALEWAEAMIGDVGSQRNIPTASLRND